MQHVTVPRATWDAMREAHRKLIRAYVNLLESGRDRIVSLGGACDPVDQMEAGDPALREAKAALTAANAVQPQAQGEAPEFLKVARRKLDDLLADGYKISGYSIERNDAHGTQRGFITAGGFVGWWNANTQATEPAWRPIETAPKDGTVIDLWHEEFGRWPGCNWGLPEHTCGESGSLCDDDVHSMEEGWVTDFNEITFPASEYLYWMPIPAAPEAKQ